MPELFFIFSPDKQLRSLQHWLYHDSTCLRYLHHAVKLKRQMLFTFNIEYHSSYIRFMNRPHNLGHHRKSTASRESKYFVFITRYKFFDYRNTGRMKQRLNIMGFDIAVLRNRINNPTNAGYIYTKKFNFRNSRFWSIYDT